MRTGDGSSQTGRRRAGLGSRTTRTPRPNDTARAVCHGDHHAPGSRLLRPAPPRPRPRPGSGGSGVALGSPCLCRPLTRGRGGATSWPSGHEAGLGATAWISGAWTLGPKPLAHQSQAAPSRGRAHVSRGGSGDACDRRAACGRLSHVHRRAPSPCSCRVSQHTPLPRLPGPGHAGGRGHAPAARSAHGEASLPRPALPSRPGPRRGGTCHRRDEPRSDRETTARARCWVCRLSRGGRGRLIKIDIKMHFLVFNYYWRDRKEKVVTPNAV